MHRLIVILVILSLTLSACAPASIPLWGVAQTPTPGALIYDPFAVQDVPFDIPNATVPPQAENDPPVIPTAAALQNDPPVIGEVTPAGTALPTFETAPILYYAQSGDMLSAVARRFGVEESEIVSDADLTRSKLIDTGTLLIIPDRLTEELTPNIEIMPDKELIFSFTAADFNVEEYVQRSGGYLSTFRDYLGSTGWIDGDKAIKRLAVDNSINPRLLLGLLEFEGRWVRGQPVDELHTSYPMGFDDYRFKGMSIQMVWAINTMAIAYYGWRAGTLTHLVFPDGTTLRIDPRLNAGTVALQYLFSRNHSRLQWEQIINPESGFPAMYIEMFGDPWSRADAIPPIFPSGLSQPPLVLPFEPGIEWSNTGGPHNAWGQINPAIYDATHSVYAAIDFAPSTDHGGCELTPTWVTAASPGLVVRSDNGAVMVDLDADGYEQTGWNLLYMHISKKDRVPVGTWLEVNDRIGHASCEGGVSTGTHLHFARKYNGEWVTADGPIPFVMDGWRVVAGEKAYEGKLVRGDQVVTADPVGQKWSNIIRDETTDAEN